MMPKRTISLLAPAFALILTAAFSGEAHATAPSPDASASASVSTSGAGVGAASGGSGHRFRLHTDGEFFGFSHWNPDGGSDDDGTNFVGFGVGRGLSTHVYGGAPGFGFSGSPLMGFGFGVVILDGNAVVGARTGMVFTALAPENDDAPTGSFFGGELLPYFRYMFLDQPVRPYVEGHLGFGGGLVKTTADLPVVGEQSQTNHVISPIFGAGGGAMLFLHNNVSLDLGLNLDFLMPHTRTTYSDEDVDDEDWEKAGDQISLTITTGISGWF